MGVVKIQHVVTPSIAEIHPGLNLQSILYVSPEIIDLGDNTRCLASKYNCCATLANLVNLVLGTSIFLGLILDTSFHNCLNTLRCMV